MYFFFVCFCFLDFLSHCCVVSVRVSWSLWQNEACPNVYPSRLFSSVSFLLHSSWCTCWICWIFARFAWGLPQPTSSHLIHSRHVVWAWSRVIHLPHSSLAWSGLEFETCPSWYLLMHRQTYWGESGWMDERKLENQWHLCKMSSFSFFVCCLAHCVWFSLSVFAIYPVFTALLFRVGIFMLSLMIMAQTSQNVFVSVGLTHFFWNRYITSSSNLLSLFAFWDILIFYKLCSWLWHIKRRFIFGRRVEKTHQREELYSGMRFLRRERN